MVIYVPGTEEKDQKKVIMSLQQLGPATSTNTTNITANTTDIATNAAAIATLNAAGYVVGPASATANGFAVYNGTTGKLIKDHAATIALASEVSGILPIANGGTGVNSFGGMVLLNTLTASILASDTTSFTSTYSSYEIVFQNIIPANATVNLQLQVHSGGSFQATSYIAEIQANTAGAASFAQPTTFIQLAASQNNAGPGISGVIRVFGPVTGTTVAKQWTGLMAGQSTTAAVTSISSGYWNSTAAVDGFQVLFSSGNITSGVIKIYGII